MKKTIGISRPKMDQLAKCKNSQNRQKQRFKFDNADINPSFEGQESNDGLELRSVTTQHSTNSIQSLDRCQAQRLYDQAREHIDKVSDQRKKMAAQIRLRITSFKESETKKYDARISEHSTKAVNHILNGERLLSQIRYTKGVNSVEQKLDSVYRNMERSLAQQIREASRTLRTQEKEYYDQLKTYQHGTENRAIQLNTEQRQKMRDEFAEVEEELHGEAQKNEQINGLVKSINQLSNVYKQLNDLVIEQGSLIDRIDFNIEETYHFVERGNEHLENVDRKARSKCAEKCVYILISLIAILAIALGFKLANTGSTSTVTPSA